MKLSHADKLVMIGDSITDCDRQRPVGEGHWGGLGRGYVALVDAALTALHPDRQVRVINTGISGNTSRDLKARWQTDVLDLEPDWVSVMIGTNDVWRQFDAPLRPEIHVHIDEYATTLDDLVRRTAPRVKGMVIMSPFYLEPNRQEPMRAAMDRYGAAARRVAEANGVLFVDIQAAMDRLLEHRHTVTLAPDRVHPTLAGHMAIARAFLDGIGCEWK